MNRCSGKPSARLSAYDKALGLLVRREHSRKELQQKLDRVGYAYDEVDEALRSLGELCYQDDRRFAEMLIRSRISRGYGPERIRLELKRHGINDAACRALLHAADVDWQQLALDELQRRYGASSADDPHEREKRVQFLLRRGFSSGLVQRVVRVA